MNVEYREKEGVLKFVVERRGIKISGDVPPAVLAGGDSAIKEYVATTMRKTIQRRKKEQARHQEISKTNVPISIKHDGHILTGKIVDYHGPSSRGIVSILLESPKQYAGEDHICGCWAMAVSGIRVFDDGGKLTAWTIARAQESFITMYDKKKNTALAVRAAKTLNRK